jgi:hypothetical protein
MDKESIRNEVHHVEVENMQEFLDNLNSDDRDEEVATAHDTISLLGGVCDIAGVEVPFPTVGMLALLDAIESPFVRYTEDVVTLNDLLKTI